jgi:hypothetical protein
MLRAVCVIVSALVAGVLAIKGDALSLGYQVVLVLIAFGAVGYAFLPERKRGR